MSEARTTLPCASSVRWTRPVTPAPRSTNAPNSVSRATRPVITAPSISVARTAFISSVCSASRIARRESTTSSPPRLQLEDLERVGLADVLLGVFDVVDVHLRAWTEPAASPDADLVPALDHLLDQAVDRMTRAERADDRGVARLARRLRLRGSLSGDGLGSGLGLSRLARHRPARPLREAAVPRRARTRSEAALRSRNPRPGPKADAPPSKRVRWRPRSDLRYSTRAVRHSATTDPKESGSRAVSRPMSAPDIDPSRTGPGS